MASSVLDRAQLEESPLADLHALAAEVGIENFRRMRREELIATLSGTEGAAPAKEAGAEEGSESGREPRARAPRRPRTRRPRGEEATASDEERPPRPERTPRGERTPRAERASRGERAPRGERPSREGGSSRGGRSRAEEEPEDEGSASDGPEEDRTGVLEIGGNGSGFMRSDPYRQADDDVYVAPAQIRRCELRSGDEISGPVRPPRRSERHPSLARIDTVNGSPAEPPAERALFDDLTAGFASERLSAPEGLEQAPYGRGSRVAVGGPPGAGITSLLRRMAASLREGHDDVDLVVVLAGARPEEVPEWRSDSALTVVGGAFDLAPEDRARGAEAALERAKRAVERGGHAALVVEGLESLPQGLGRRLFGAARRAEEGGSLTVIASAVSPDLERYATTRIVLEAGAAGAPVVSAASGTLRAESLG